MREAIFREVPAEWRAAYDAGVFTEFMEQRAPGHTVLGDVIYRRGFLDLAADCDRALAALDWDADPRAYDKSLELRAMRQSARGHHPLRRAVRRPRARPGRRRARSGAARRSCCRSRPSATACRRIAPRTFWEALQAYWFVHLGVVTELNTWDSFCPGRLDQHLQPFYERDLADGRLTRDRAKELLECFWVKFNNQPAPPKVGVTAAESGTYTDFCNINVGGLTVEGDDGVNDVSYLLLEVIDEMHLLQPSSNIQLSAKNPDRFLTQRVRHHPPGLGPAVGVQRRHGRRGTAAAGQADRGRARRRHERLRRDGRVRQGSLHPDGLLQPAEGARDRAERRRRSGHGPAHRRPDGRPGVVRVVRARCWTRSRASSGTSSTSRSTRNRIIERLYATRMPAPFLSLVIDDCIANGTDYNAGGARYNTTYIMPVGIGTVTDALSAIRLPRLREAGRDDAGAARRRSARDFDGDEVLRQRLWNKTPRYGNDDPAADTLLQRVFDVVPRHRRRPAEHARRRASSELPVDDLPRVFRIEGRRDAGRPARASSRCRTAFRRFRDRTRRGRRPCSSRPRAWTTRARAARCST